MIGVPFTHLATGSDGAVLPTLRVGAAMDGVVTTANRATAAENIKKRAANFIEAPLKR